MEANCAQLVAYKCIDPERTKRQQQPIHHTLSSFSIFFFFFFVALRIYLVFFPVFFRSGGVGNQSRRLSLSTHIVCLANLDGA